MTYQPITSPIKIELLDSLSLHYKGKTLRHFTSQKSASLLAYLAYHKGRERSRELLCDLLWPDVDPAVSRNRLSTALWALRRDLEQLGIPKDAVLIADRLYVSLNPAMFVTDVEEFESGIDLATHMEVIEERITLLSSTLPLYRGTLLPGFYEEWVAPEQSLLAEHYIKATLDLTQCLQSKGQPETALKFVRRALSIEPLDEHLCRCTMNLNLELGRSLEAIQCYNEFERACQSYLNMPPSHELVNYAKIIQSNTVCKSESPTAQRTKPHELNVVEERSKVTSPPSTPPEPNTKWQFTHPFGKRVALFGFSAVLAALYFHSFSAPSPPKPVVMGSQLHASLPPQPHTEPQTQKSLPPQNEAQTPTPKQAHKTVEAVALPRSGRTSLPAPLKKETTKLHNGKLAWAIRYQPLSDETDSQAIDMKVDGEGNVYLCGLVKTLHNDSDFLTAKYDPTGKLLWRRRYNGPINDCDRARSLAIAPEGSVYVTGDSYGGDKEKGLTQWDITTIKYDKYGNEIWVRRFNAPPSRDDAPQKVLADGNKGIYVTGTSTEGNQSPYYILVRYSSEGKQEWAQRCDHSLNRQDPIEMKLMDSCIDKNGNAYLAGIGWTQDSFGSKDISAVTLSYDRYGNQVWFRRFSSRTGAHQLTYDEKGNLIVVGSCMDKQNREASLAIKYDQRGLEHWSQVFTDNQHQGFPNSLAIAEDGALYFTELLAGKGYHALIKCDSAGHLLWKEKNAFAPTAPAWSPHSIVTTYKDGGASTLTSPDTVDGTGDIALRRYDGLGKPLWTQTYGGGRLAYTGAFLLGTDEKGDTYVAGQFFGKNGPHLEIIKFEQ